MSESQQTPVADPRPSLPGASALVSTGTPPPVAVGGMEPQGFQRFADDEWTVLAGTSMWFGECGCYCEQDGVTGAVLYGEYCDAHAAARFRQVLQGCE